MRHSFWLLVVLGTSLVPLLMGQTFPLPSTQPQEELLKAEGLTKKGWLYLLETDLKLEESLRPVRKAQAQFQLARRKRADIEQDIKRADADVVQWAREHEDLQGQLAQTKDVRKYNAIVGEMNNLANRVKETLNFKKQREQDLQKLGNAPDDYMTLTMDLADKMESTAKRYEALAADQRVQKALTDINAMAAHKLKLGPSASFLEELPRWRKLRAAIDAADIKLDTEHGVPMVEVTLNGSHKQRMVLDSGASVVLLTAEAAQEIGLTPGPNDPTITMVTANGVKVDARLMHLESIRLAQFTAENVECTVLPATVKGATCLLGGTFLRHFVYKMDLAAGTLHMLQVRDSQPETKKPSGGSTGTGSKTPASGAKAVAKP